MYSKQKYIFLNSYNRDPTVYGPVLNCKRTSYTSSVVIVNISDQWIVKPSPNITKNSSVLDCPYMQINPLEHLQHLKADVYHFLLQL